MTGRPERPVPSPKALAGRKDPARSVRPVDWTAVPERRPEQAARPEQADLPSAPLPRRRARTVQLPRAASAAPSDAVHTLDADDPRPLPRPLRIRDEDIRAVGRLCATLDGVIVKEDDDPRGRARALAQHPGYAFIEVYPTRLITVSASGQTAVIDI